MIQCSLITNGIMLSLPPGTHWTWEMVRMLKTGESELTSLDMKAHMFLNVQPEDLEALPSPRVLASHRQFHDLPSDFIIKKCPLVLVIRDPRDVCVSLYNLVTSSKKLVQYAGTFGGFQTLFLQGKGNNNYMIITLKGPIRDFLQSPQCAANCLQYVLSVTRAKSRANRVQQINRLSRATCSVPLGTKRHLSY